MIITPQSKTPPEPDSPSELQPLWALAWRRSDGIRRLSTAAEIGVAMASGDERLWIDLEAPPRELLLELSGILGLHPLVTEDILERNQRAKVEHYDDSMHMVMFGLAHEGEIVTHEVDIVLGKSFLLTAHDVGIDPRSAPFLRRDEGAHLSGGADFVLWALTDWIVDRYFPVFDQLGDEIDDLQADVMHRPTKWVVERLFQVRRDLLRVRHAVSPQREIFNQLTNRDSKLIDPRRYVYFRDVYDHLIRLTDELDIYRELVSTSLDIYVSQVNNNLSEVMKRLTAITAVLAGAGALAGIFGMSEAGLAISFADLRFWMVTGAIGVMTALGFLYFRRIGWI